MSPEKLKKKQNNAFESLRRGTGIVDKDLLIGAFENHGGTVEHINGSSLKFTFEEQSVTVSSVGSTVQMKDLSGVSSMAHRMS